ncbi:MAG: SGNH/GDSL hydrolase family protein [Betaproteobacteria bacterium]
MRHVSWLAAASVLVACSDNPVYIDGFAATGAAMANANVTAKCVEGSEVTGKTDANGLFQLRIDGGQVAPCIVQVTDGAGTSLHSFASGPGRLNVTPLTELSVGKALGGTPATAFSSFDRTKSTTIANGLPAAMAAVKAEVEALTGKTIAGDMLVSSFKVGDPDDLVLDTLKVKLQDLGKPLADVTAALVASKPLSTIAPRVRVFGDSLSDSGTFGLKFTVQGSAATGPGSSSIWVDVVAAQYQKKLLCPYFRITGSAVATESGCTNYAIGGGRINNFTDPGSPLSVVVQLQTAAQIHGAYTASDILLIDGGGNDAADLAGAWLAAGTTTGAQNFQALLASVLGPEATGALLSGGPSGAVLAGASYMENLADRFADAIVVNAVNKGAQKVLVMNLPDIALTPRFSAVLAGVTAQAGAEQAASVKGVIQSWVNTFNTKLASRFGPSTTAGPKVAVLDFNKTFREQVATPGAFGFTNGTGTACPVTGTDNSGLPTYTFPTCTAAALSATSGKPSADWWQTYLFSDGFHPTPRAHQKAAEQTLAVLAQRGWN